MCRLVMHRRVMRPHARSWLRSKVWLRSRAWLAALLLSAGWMDAGWSAAQTGQSQTAQAGQNQPTQNQPVQATLPVSGPAQVTATPTDALISALRRSLVQEARGEALLELVFPPSSTPVRRARALPRLGTVPALIRRNFVVTATPDTVAGRPATRYLLTPNNAQAARWTIWIDSRWKVPLAYQERLPDGTLARRAELLSVNPGLNRLAARTAQTPVPGLKKALLGALPGLSLPAGFEPLRVRMRAGAVGAAATEVVFSDGLNVLALVVSSRAVRQASGVAVRRLGGPGLGGLSGQSVWLVGNLPQNTLESALSGIRRLDTAALVSMTGTFGSPAASEE